MSSFSNFLGGLNHFTRKHSKYLNLLFLLIIVAAVPLSVYVSQQSQDTRQRAESCSCGSYEDCTHNNDDGSCAETVTVCSPCAPSGGGGGGGGGGESNPAPTAGSGSGGGGGTKYTNCGWGPVGTVAEGHCYCDPGGQEVDKKYCDGHNGGGGGGSNPAPTSGSGSGGGGGGTPVNTPKGSCTEGNYDRQCTGNHPATAGCALGTGGEAQIYQCTGGAWVRKNNECRNECAGKATGGFKEGATPAPANPGSGVGGAAPTLAPVAKPTPAAGGACKGLNDALTCTGSCTDENGASGICGGHQYCLTDVMVYSNKCTCETACDTATKIAPTSAPPAATACGYGLDNQCYCNGKLDDPRSCGGSLQTGQSCIFTQYCDPNGGQNITNGRQRCNGKVDDHQACVYTDGATCDSCLSIGTVQVYSGGKCTNDAACGNLNQYCEGDQTFQKANGACDTTTGGCSYTRTIISGNPLRCGSVVGAAVPTVAPSNGQYCKGTGTCYKDAQGKEQCFDTVGVCGYQPEATCLYSEGNVCHAGICTDSNNCGFNQGCKSSPSYSAQTIACPGADPYKGAERDTVAFYNYCRDVVKYKSYQASCDINGDQVVDKRDLDRIQQKIVGNPNANPTTSIVPTTQQPLPVKSPTPTIAPVKPPFATPTKRPFVPGQ